MNAAVLRASRARDRPAARPSDQLSHAAVAVVNRLPRPRERRPPPLLRPRTTVQRRIQRVLPPAGWIPVHPGSSPRAHPSDRIVPTEWKRAISAPDRVAQNRAAARFRVVNPAAVDPRRAARARPTRVQVPTISHHRRGTVVRCRRTAARAAIATRRERQLTARRLPTTVVATIRRTPTILTIRATDTGTSMIRSIRTITARTTAVTATGIRGDTDTVLVTFLTIPTCSVGSAIQLLRRQWRLVRRRQLRSA